MRWDRRDWFAIVGLLLAPLLFFWRLVVPGDGRYYFESGDFVDQFYAFAVFETNSLAAGRLPLWNPSAYSGSPFWADIQSAVAYPPSLATVLASIAAFGRLPFLALELEAVAHFALAGIFTYLFARHVIGSRAGALVTAVTFAFGGYLTGYPPLQLAVLETNVWLPLALLGVAIIATNPLGIPLTAVAMGMGILAGHPQSALYMLYATVAYFAWLVWPWRETGLRPWLLLIAALGLGLGLAAVGWLPALEYLRASNRAAADYATLAHGFPPRELIGIVLPGITKWAPLYIGVLSLLLAVNATRHAITESDRAARQARFWLALGIVTLLLSLGGNAFLYDLFYLAAPGFDLFRGQERAALLVSFSLAMLAGIGFATWRRDGARTDRTILVSAAAFTVLGLSLALVATPDVRPLAFRLALLAGSAALLALAHHRRLIRGHALIAVVLALIGIDLYVVGAMANLQADAPGELQVTPIIEALQGESEGRVQNDDRHPRNFGVLHGIESTYGASPLRPDTYDALHQGLMPEHEVRLWDLLGVRHVVTWRAEIPAASEVFATEGEGETIDYLHELDAPRQRVWRVNAAEAISDDSAAVERLRDPTFDPTSTALLHDTGADILSSGAAPGSSELISRSIGEIEARTEGDASIGEIEARTEGDGPGWLVFSEVHYPGWRATVDGAEANIVRADVALMAVPVPAGAHDVRVWFTAPTVNIGLALSLLSALALATLTVVVVGRRSSRANSGTERRF